MRKALLAVIPITISLSIASLRGVGGIATSAALPPVVGDFSGKFDHGAASTSVGGQAAYTVTVTPSGGFTGDVTLAVSALPAGTTGSWSPAVVTGGSGNSTLTLTTSGTTPPGIYNLTVTGTSGTLVHSTTLELLVGTRDFTGTVTPTTQSVTAGGNAQYNITLSAVGTLPFGNDVTLTLSGLPSGVTAVFSTTTVNPDANGTSLLTLGTSSTTLPGSYTIALTGSGGGTSHTTRLQLVVAPPGASTGDFSGSFNHGSASAPVGGQATYLLTVSPSGGFNGTVVLSAWNLPPGSTASWSPALVTGGAGNSTLTVTTGASTPPGIYYFTASGASGALVRSTTLTLLVGTVDFTGTISPRAQTVVAGASAQFTIALSTVGTLPFGGGVTLAVSGLPAGVTAGFSNPTINPDANGSSVMTLTTSSTAPDGTYVITISGTGQGAYHATTITLTVVPIAINPSTVNLLPGGSQSFTVTIAGQTNPTVKWSIVETNGGSITQSGSYTATNTPGVYHVLVVSQSTPTLSATAVVNVAPATSGLGFMAPAWQAIGPRAIPNAHACDNTAEATLLAAGRIQAFTVNLTNPSIMYAGGGVGTGNSGPFSDAGVYASTDGGLHWIAKDNGMTDRFVDALWLDQSNPSTLLASTFYGGIFRSTDSGQSWTNVLSSPTTSIVQVSSTLLAAAAEGIVTSPDSGATWTLQQPTTSPVRTLACGGGGCYAGLDDGSVLVQASSALGWVTSRPGSAGITAYDVTVNPLNGLQAIVVLGPKPQNLVTQDGGKSWTTFNSPPMQSGVGTFNCSGGPAKVVAFDTVNPNIIWAGSGGSIWVSLNGAGSWTPLHLYEDHNLLYPIPGKSGQVVVGGDQGIYMSQDTGATWTTLNGDLSTNLLNDIAVNGMEISTTVQDFSPIQSFDGGNTWSQLSNPNPSARPQGENGVVLIDPKSPQYQYFFNGAGFWYSSDGGNNFTVDNANLPSSEWTYNGTTDYIAIDPSNSAHLYLVGSTGIFKSTDFGVHWQPTGWPISSPSFIAIDPNNPSTIFVGSSQFPPLLFTHDGGTTWNPAILPKGAFWPVSLAVDPSNSSIAVLAVSGTPNQPGGGVLISTDGGATFSSDFIGLATYSPVGKFEHYAWSVRFAPPAYPHVLAVATTDGLFISKAGGSWTQISGNAIPQWFQAIAWDSGYLYAATYGQGILKAPVPQIVAP